MPALKCKICGVVFPALKEHHYISRDLTKTGLAVAFGSTDEPLLYDSFDCPCCGSQVIAQPRKREYDPKLEETTDEDLLANMSNDAIAEHLGISPRTVELMRSIKGSDGEARNKVIERFTDEDIYNYMQRNDLRPSEAAKNLNIPRERVIKAMDNVNGSAASDEGGAHK